MCSPRTPIGLPSPLAIELHRSIAQAIHRQRAAFHALSRRPPCGRFRLADGGSALAVCAVEGRSLGLAQASHRCAADAARLPRASVDETVELEVPRRTVARDEVAQAAAATADRVRQ